MVDITCQFSALKIKKVRETAYNMSALGHHHTKGVCGSLWEIQRSATECHLSYGTY